MNTRRQYEAWLRTRPAIVRVIGLRLKPWRLYRIKPTGQLCRVEAISESGTIRVFAWQEDFGPMLGHGVFGVPPSDLECVADSLPPEPEVKFTEDEWGWTMCIGSPQTDGSGYIHRNFNPIVQAMQEAK